MNEVWGVRKGRGVSGGLEQRPGVPENLENKGNELLGQDGERDGGDISASLESKKPGFQLGFCHFLSERASYFT